MTDETTFDTFADHLLDLFGGGDEAEGTMRDLARGGAAAGFHGITYYRDTVALYGQHEDEIWTALAEDADEMGLPNPLALIASLVGADNVNSDDQLANLLVWYMAERVAREYDR